MKKIIVCCVAVVTSLLLCVAGGLVLHRYTDVFSFLEKEKHIDYEDVEKNYRKELSDVRVTDDSDIDRATVLYDALLANENLTDAEKMNSSKFLQYFADNKYLDCQEVSEKLSSFIVTPNDPSLLDLGIGAEYKDENTITFATDEYREYSLSHELHHCIENGDLSYELYGWFGEGVACLVNYEYFDSEPETYNLQTFFVRGLCEIVGHNIIFEVSATGNMDILINALESKGVDRNKITEAFDLFTELKDCDSAEGSITVEQRYKAVQVVLDMYNMAYGNSENISYSLYVAAEHFYYLDTQYDKCYYLNSVKRNYLSTAYYSFTQGALESLYKEACLVVTS